MTGLEGVVVRGCDRGLLGCTSDNKECTDFSACSLPRVDRALSKKETPSGTRQEGSWSQRKVSQVVCVTFWAVEILTIPRQLRVDKGAFRSF